MRGAIRVAAVLRESEWTPVGDLLGRISDLDELDFRRSVGEASAHFKRTLSLRGAPIELDDSLAQLRIRVAGIAGTIRLGRWVLDVQPKFVDTTGSAANWRVSVLLLLSRVRGRHVMYNPVADLGHQGLTFVDHMALAFSDAVERAVIEEPIHVYREREEQASVLRGRLNLPRQLRGIWNRPHVLECDVQYLDTDNHFNRLLHWAGVRLAQLAVNASVVRRVEAAASSLPPIGGGAQLPIRLAAHVPPQYRAWQDAISLAAELARGQVTSMSSGPFPGYGFVLAMDELFERFLEVSLRRALREWLPEFEIRPQDSQPFAYPMSGGRKFFTRPDDVIYADGSPIAVVDAKYKRLASTGESASLRKPKNPDVYQILAAMTAHQCNRGILVFPKIAGRADLGDDELRWWRVPTSCEDVYVSSVAIDLAQLQSHRDLRTLDRRLADIVSEATTGGSPEVGSAVA